jgi:hypothetical protein
MAEGTARNAIEYAYRRLRETIEGKQIDTADLKVAALAALDKARAHLEGDPVFTQSDDPVFIQGELERLVSQAPE